VEIKKKTTIPGDITGVYCCTHV